MIDPPRTDPFAVSPSTPGVAPAPPPTERPATDLGGPPVESPAPSSASRRFGLTVLVATLAAFALVLAVLAWRDDGGRTATSSTIDGVESTTNDTDAPPQRDLTGSLSCGAEVGVLRAQGSVTNHAAASADYTVAVEWVDGSAVLGRGTTQVQAVRAGQTRMFEVSSPGGGIASMSCRVTRIDRVDAGA
jgi:hypothetical protein